MATVSSISASQNWSVRIPHQPTHTCCNQTDKSSHTLILGSFTGTKANVGPEGGSEEKVTGSLDEREDDAFPFAVFKDTFHYCF